MENKARISGLIVRAKSGDQEALTQIVQRFQPILKKYSHRIGNDDAYSDLVIWIINAVKRYQLGNNWGKNEPNRFLLIKKGKYKQ